MVIVALLAGCSTLSTLDGAKTLPPHTVQLGGGVSVQAGASPISQVGVPLPQLEGDVRVALAEDVDLGFRVYLLGVGSDVRYRFFHEGPWHLATGVGIAGLPLGTSGSVETRLPLTAERDLGERWSIAGGPRLILRDQWNATEGGTVARFDTFAGGMLRGEYAAKRFFMDLGGDLLARPSRSAPPAWSIVYAFGWRFPSGRRGREAESRDVAAPGEAGGSTLGG